MDIADRFSRNGRLSVTEIKTYLQGTKFEPFAAWVSDTKTMAKLDADRDGTLDIGELATAVGAFYDVE